MRRLFPVFPRLAACLAAAFAVANGALPPSAPPPLPDIPLSAFAPNFSQASELLRRLPPYYGFRVRPSFAPHPVFPVAHYLGIGDPWAVSTAFAPDVPADWSVPESALKYVPPAEVQSWNWEVQTHSTTLPRETNQASLTTVSPVTLSFLYLINTFHESRFRPTLSAGAGVLRQTKEGRDIGADPKNELLPLLHAGFGAEWEPLERLIFRINYDYSQLPMESALTPNMPDKGHSVQVGLEVKF